MPVSVETHAALWSKAHNSEYRRVKCRGGGLTERTGTPDPNPKSYREALEGDSDAARAIGFALGSFIDPSFLYEQDLDNFQLVRVDATILKNVAVEEFRYPKVGAVTLLCARTGTGARNPGPIIYKFSAMWKGKLYGPFLVEVRECGFNEQVENRNKFVAAVQRLVPIVAQHPYGVQEVSEVRSLCEHDANDRDF